MNEDKNSIVNTVRWIVTTLERSLVVLFDGIKNAVEHASPSLHGLISVTLPILMPLPIAAITASNAGKVLGLTDSMAVVLAVGLELLGFLAWAKLSEAIVRGENETWILWVTCFTYEGILIYLNVYMASTSALLLLAVCSLPALSAILYGRYKRELDVKQEALRREDKDLSEKIRQERRQDRKESAKLKIAYSQDTKEVKPSQGGKFQP